MITPAPIDDLAGVATYTVAFDPLHVPATHDGGDAAWCEVIPLASERQAFALGRVAGGPAAVAGLRAAVHEAFAAPAPAAPATDVGSRPAPTALPTALVGVIDCRDGSLSYANADAPAPCIRFADGTVAALPAGALLDAGSGIRPANVVVDLAGAAALIFAAGLSAAPDSTELLRTALQSLHPNGCARPAAALAPRLVPAERPDEIILLGVALGSALHADRPGVVPRWSVTWSFDTTAVAAPGVRRAFMACLRAKTGAVPVDFDAAELIFGEMLGNVIRHAPGPVEITLDWTGDLPRLHMLDEGPGFASRRSRERLPADDWSESGRGLFIMNACATAFSLRNRTSGRGTHACATLRPAETPLPPSR